MALGRAPIKPVSSVGSDRRRPGRHRPPVPSRRLPAAPLTPELLRPHLHGFPRSRPGACRRLRSSLRNPSRRGPLPGAATDANRTRSLAMITSDSDLISREPLNKSRSPSASLFAGGDGVAAKGRRPAEQRAFHGPHAAGHPSGGPKGRWLCCGSLCGGQATRLGHALPSRPLGASGLPGLVQRFPRRLASHNPCGMRCLEFGALRRKASGRNPPYPRFVPSYSKRLYLMYGQRHLWVGRLRMYYTPGQLREAAGLSKEAFRYWKRALRGFPRGKPHGRSFSPGDVLASAILAFDARLRRPHRTLEGGVEQHPRCLQRRAVGRIGRQDSCRRSAPTSLFHDAEDPPDPGDGAVVVCPMGPVIAMLCDDLVQSSPKAAGKPREGHVEISGPAAAGGRRR